MARKSKHRGAAAVRAAEPERLSLPVFIKRELARLKQAGLWDGNPDDPNLDPAVVLTQLMVDDRLAPEPRAVCAKTLLPYFHDDRALLLKAEQGPETDQLFVLIKQFATPGLPTAKGINDLREPPVDAPGTPEPPGGAAPIAATRNFGTAFYEMQKGDDGIERMVQVDGPPRAYNGTPPTPKIESEF